MLPPSTVAQFSLMWPLECIRPFDVVVFRSFPPLCSLLWEIHCVACTRDAFLSHRPVCRSYGSQFGYCLFAYCNVVLFTSSQELTSQSVRCSVVGLAAEVRLCKTISQRTQGPFSLFSDVAFLLYSSPPLLIYPLSLLLVPSPPPSPSSSSSSSPSLSFVGSYSVITDETHFRDTMLQHCRPPPAKVCCNIHTLSVVNEMRVYSRKIPPPAKPRCSKRDARLIEGGTVSK